MKKTTALAFLMLSVSLLAACNTGYSSYCNGNAGKLHKAFDKGDSRQVEKLLKKNINPDANCMSHPPLLIKAAVKGDLEFVQSLINKGADINIADEYGPGDTALIAAASFGHKDMVELLLDNKAAINKKDYSGKTALQRALEKGHEEIGELLRSKGGI